MPCTGVLWSFSGFRIERIHCQGQGRAVVLVVGLFEVSICQFLNREADESRVKDHLEVWCSYLLLVSLQSVIGWSVIDRSG